MRPKPYPNLYPFRASYPFTSLYIKWISQNSHLVGGFNHLEKYESQWEGVSHI